MGSYTGCKSGDAMIWLLANWKKVVMAVVVASSFGGGWFVRGEIAEAAQNRAIAQAIEETKKQEKALYEKATQLEKRKRAIREKARLANTDINKAAGDSCSDKPIPSGWLLIIHNAYDNIAG